MPFVRPVFENAVFVLLVFATMVMKLSVHAFLRSILYPLIGIPPELAGASQLRLICDEDTAVAFNNLGALGSENVVAEAVFDGFPTPTALIAETLY